ncbi:MAG: carboxypeptidase-like regulatory domain-containing protein [Microscillaceae bacterium]|nr:carboxypeptidase-like regulatory domain-containing protein [Microscillaceae bacterium]
MMKNYQLSYTKSLPRFLYFWGIMGLLGFSLPAFGQSTDATLFGLIRDNAGQPLAGATVAIKNSSTGFTTGAITGADGRYRLSQLPLGGPYSVTVSFVGYKDQSQGGFYLNQGDRITVNMNLNESNETLQEIVISGDLLIDRVDRLGSTTSIGSAQIRRLPNENRNFTDLARLNPLFGTGNLGIGGQRRTGTNITVDGVNARNQLTAGEIGRGPFTISQEAIREFEVAVNEYSVTQGRQSGGALNAVTKSGTNEFHGSAFTYHRADFLANPKDIRGEDRDVDFNNTQWGFSVGGPIIKDKLHFFVAFDRQDAAQPIFIADIRSEADEIALGIRKDTLENFLAVARELYGLSDAAQTGQFNRKTTANTVFARLDWQISKKHVITLRNNFSNWDDPNSINDNSNINLFETWGNFSSWENSTLVSLRSNFSSQVTNELKVQYQHAEREFGTGDQIPSANIPRAIVRVTSAFPTENNPNATTTRTVQFGGQRFTPETNAEDQFQIVNTLYWNKNNLRFTFGTDNTLTYLNTLLSNEQNGRFEFNNFNDFRNLRANRFFREVPVRDPSVQQWVLDASLFGELEFNPAASLTLNVGLRWDLTAFLTPADYNPLVEEGLGLRTDESATDWDNIQPRLQLTWDIGNRNKDIIRFGAGIFNAQPHYYAQVNNIQNSGLNLVSVDVFRNSGLVPTPDFPAYRNDPSTAPGVPEGFANPPSTINLIGEDFEVPSTFKANVSYNRFFGNRARVGINFIYARGWDGYVYLDRNLVDEPFFRLSNENNRGVFVPANTINVNNGNTNNVNARKTQLVGRTLELVSESQLNQIALVVDGEYRIGKDGGVTVSYTYNNTRDNSSYNCCVANTSTFLPVVDDPRTLTWGSSDNDFRHKLVVYGNSPTFYGFNVGLTFTAFSGTPFSFQINGGGDDINGDFVQGNELAFVFDPNDPNTPEAIRDGLLDLSGRMRKQAREYLEESYGKFAQRNGGKNPLFGTVDMRISKNFAFAQKKHNLEVTLDIFNLMNLLNSDWGGNYNLGNAQRLLDVRSFDPTTQNFNYTVQSNAGITQKGGTPYQIMLGGRYSF